MMNIKRRKVRDDRVKREAHDMRILIEEHIYLSLNRIIVLCCVQSYVGINIRR